MMPVTPRSPLAVEIAALNAAFQAAGLEGVVAAQPFEKNARHDMVVTYPMSANSITVHQVVMQCVKNRAVLLKPVVAV